MTVPLQWFWPPPRNSAARGISMAASGASGIVADWYRPILWPFSASGFLSQPIYLGGGSGYITDDLDDPITDDLGGPIMAVFSSDPTGISSLAVNGSGWAVSYGGTLYEFVSGGPTSIQSLPSGTVYVGCAAPNGSGFALGADGVVYGSGAIPLGSWPVSGIGLSWSGTTLASLLPASGVGLMNASTAVTGLIALPSAIASPSALAVSGGSTIPIAIAGWQPAPNLSGAAAAALNVATPTVMAAVGSGYALLWDAPAAQSNAWSETQALSGLANLTACAWRPDAQQVLTASLASGVVQVLQYSFGALSLAQTLSVSGACSIAIAADSVHALVAQSGQASLLPLLYSGSTWASGTPIGGLSGIVAVASYGASGAVAACLSGVTFLTLGTGGWTVTSSASIGYAPTVLTVDSLMNVYAAASGRFSIVTSGVVTGSGAWSGNPTALVTQSNGRPILATSGGWQSMGESSAGVWTPQLSGTWALGASPGLALAETTLFAIGSGATTMFGFSGTPFTLTQINSGAVAQWNGSAWTTTVLGIGATPSSCVFDASGNVWVSTIENTLWSVSSGGAVLSSATIAQYQNSQTVSLGISALLWFDGHLYGATSIPGVLGQLV